MNRGVEKTAGDKPRVVVRQHAAGAGESRRRIFQRHLILYLVVNVGVVFLDHSVIAPFGIQWAQWIAVPWTLLFALHMVGLKSRGYSWGELLTPPRVEPPEEEYTDPLEYEVIRARQLHDGVASAAAAVRSDSADVAEAAVSAADDLLAAVEQRATAIRATGDGDAVEAAVPDFRAALDTLDALHDSLIAMDVLGEDGEKVPIEAVRERVRRLRKLTGPEPE